MKRSIAQALDEQIVHFLVKHNQLPAFKDREDEIEAIERKLTNRLVRLQTGLESSFIQAIRERGYIPASEAEQNQLIDLILTTPFEEMQEAIADNSLESSEVGRQLTMEDIVQQGMEITFSSFSEDVQEMLWNRTYQFSADTFTRIKGDFIKTLNGGVSEGLGIDDIADRLRTDFSNLRHHRLQIIARTEVQGAQNEGINETMRDFNVRYKQWITVGDSRVRGREADDRADHVSLHGQVVKFDETFTNGLMHPLDRSRGRIADWINCRCRMRPYIPKQGEVIMTTPYYPAA
ncbi:phage head morphogenesis protein [Gracilibacillus sp. D59]|uniref:phage head morphogenesis protein n=1 Tax=Gracilibacillus sp. D59 TaxID=3457434 RepID=UPI003FCCB980